MKEAFNNRGIRFGIGDKVQSLSKINGLRLTFKIQDIKNLHNNIMASSEYGDINIDLLEPVKK